MNQYQFKSIVAAIIGFVVLALVVNFFAMERAKIEAQKQIEVEEIRKIENVERTEERSQFWQKLIPWGADEDEQGN